MKGIDFGKTASDYGRHRAGFPERFFDRLFEAGWIKKGDRALDLGTGTGTIARGLARRGCEVAALDPSAPLLEEAKRLDAAQHLTVRYIQATAENSELPARSFDTITAGQCWHWFDRARVALEAKRLLMPGGTLIIAHFDWLPLPGNVVAATEMLIEQHNPNWKLGGTTGLHPAWLMDVAVAGFEDIETFSFDEAVSYTHEAWRGRIRASAGVAASLPPDSVAKFDAALAQLLARDYGDDPMLVPHRVWALVARSPQTR